MQREKASVAAVKEEERNGDKMYSQRERRRNAHTQDTRIYSHGDSAHIERERTVLLRQICQAWGSTLDEHSRV